ncbi:MAG: virulence RhuM family protein [Prevotellaceae bacterium]|nr:virulence RhuM family protein [Prevotellaceae bacterium]
MSEETGKGNIILYQTSDGRTRIEVTLSDDTVWLTADQMAELFQRNKSTISRHIKNIFETGELRADMVVAFYATTTRHGAIEGKTQTHQTAYYNLDMIISVGYRVNSHRGVQFRVWATPKRTDAEVAKNYLSPDELDTLNHIVSLYLDFAELQAKSHKPMYMKDWIEKLDDFLKLTGKELLAHTGRISAGDGKVESRHGV